MFLQATGPKATPSMFPWETRVGERAEDSFQSHLSKGLWYLCHQVCGRVAEI